jgi:hypothetical protein
MRTSAEATSDVDPRISSAGVMSALMVAAAPEGEVVVLSIGLRRFGTKNGRARHSWFGITQMADA